MTNPAKILSPREMPSVKQIHFAFGAASHHDLDIVKRAAQIA
jgi:hypothetical protein